MTQASPATFGKYQILDRITGNGVAEVYKARLDGIGGFHRTFAVKRILPHLTAQPGQAEILVSQAKMAGLLSHANIIQIMDLGEVNGAYYIAMEYLEGPDLGRVLERCRTKGISLPVPHTVFIAIEMLKGLEYAHQRQVMRGGVAMPLNIVHQDLAPNNVLLSFQGEVKLTDFGIAHATRQLLGPKGLVMDHLAPEDLAGRPVDQRADIFTTGVVMYQMLTGRHPFQGPTPEATRDNIAAGKFEAPSKVNPDVPYPLDLVLERALKKDPNGRFESATTMKDALDRFFHDAGFIFSHSTLAAFLKGLLPDEARKSSRAAPPPSAEEQVTRPLEPGEDLDDAPTAIDASVGPHTTAPFQRAMLTPNLAGLGLGHDTAPPLLPPDPASDALTAIQRRPVEQWNDAQTAIRPDPTTEERPRVGAGMGQEDTRIHEFEPRATMPMANDPSGRHPDNFRSQSISLPLPVVGEATVPDAGLPTPDFETGPSGQLPHARTIANRRFQVVYLAFGIAVTVVVLFVGFTLGMQAERATASGTVGTSGTLRNPPVLILELPDWKEGMEVSVAGETFRGPPPYKINLVPGQRTQVAVTDPEHYPHETMVTLDHNEKLVLTIRGETLRQRL